jgi:hypothetical protein
MNKFVLGALALAATSAPSLAGSGTEDWTKLDLDIESLATSLAPQSSGASVNGFVKTSYAGSSDVSIADPTSATGGTNDLGGFSLDVIRLNFMGSVGNFGLFISLDGATQTANVTPNDAAGNPQTPGESLGGVPLMLPSHLSGSTGTAGGVSVLDAYATFKITNEISGQAGEFRPPFLGEALHSEDQLLFMDRSALGDFWAFRDQGAMISANFGQIGAWLAIMNGVDGAGDKLAWSGRIQFTAMGTPPTVEGAYGASGQSNLVIGAGYYNDDTLNDGTAWCFDAVFNVGAFSASGEVVGNDKDVGFVLPADDTIGGGAGGTVSSNTFDATPWNVAVGFMFVPNQWEAAVRYEDFDDDQNTNAITAGINWYQAGHAAKVQFNYSTVASDDSNNEIDMWQLGLTASI